MLLSDAKVYSFVKKKLEV